jgi:hypothetical protein
MSQVILRNNSNTPLGIPNNPLLMPGESRSVKYWDSVQKNFIVKSWLKSRILEVVGEELEPEPEPEQEPEPEPEPTETLESKGDANDPVNGDQDNADDEDLLGDKPTKTEKQEEEPARRRRRRQA